MDFGLSAPIPPASSLTFHGGIKHPDLWLWDAWTCRTEMCRTGDEISLFTLALARHSGPVGAGSDRHGDRAIAPGARNDYKFHIRRFSSRDDGATWRDCGHYLSPFGEAAGVVSRNVWSGSATPAGDRLIFAFTGVRQPSRARPFVQSICAVSAPLDMTPPWPDQTVVISDPDRDYDAIRAAGYYLGPRDRLGHQDGEDGGPILAWRDPYLLARPDGTFEAFWAAKVSPTRPAVAHARLTLTGDGFDVDLRDPILLPDDGAFTQAEVPKVYHDAQAGVYYMLVSTCNRRHEGQPDHEVSKELRLYTCDRVDGDWQPYDDDGSIIPGLDGLFGASLIACDYDARTASLIGPYTEMVHADLQLTFAPPVEIRLRAAHETAPRPAARQCEEAPKIGA